MLMTDENAQVNSLELVTELTIAWLSNPNTAVSPMTSREFSRKCMQPSPISRHRKRVCLNLKEMFTGARRSSTLSVSESRLRQGSGNNQRVSYFIS
jgi:hypothetical protein